jgi:hypothetical protein
LHKREKCLNTSAALVFAGDKSFCLPFGVAFDDQSVETEIGDGLLALTHHLCLSKPNLGVYHLVALAVVKARNEATVARSLTRFQLL